MNYVYESTFLCRELYQSVLTPLCIKYELTHAELIVLLFLSQNAQTDTASDIVKSRRLTKSAVSAAVHTLEKRGLVTGEYSDGNHRSIHLKICKEAEQIITEGKAAQNAFYKVLTNGFSEAEKSSLKEFLKRISLNIKTYNLGKTSAVELKAAQID